MNAVLFAILAYVLAQFVLGAWVSRRMANETDYILAGRSLTTPLVMFAVFATFFGSEALTATSASVYEKGLSGALVDPLCYAAAMVIAGLFFAGRMRSAELTTFADLFRNRFSPTVEQLVVLVLLPGSLFWAAAQIRVFGVILNANAGIGLAAAIAIAAVVVLAYSIVGGLLADTVTDFIHGLVVIAGLLALYYAASGAIAAKGGGVASLTADRMTLIDPELSWLTLADKLLVPLCGTIVAVELISRFLGAKSSRVAATGTALGGIMYGAFGLIPVYLGLAGPSLIPGLKDTEELVSRLAEQLLPLSLFAVFLGAIISAILSTVHATLHAPAAQIAHNIILRRRPNLPPRQRLWTARATVGGLGLVAYLLAATSDTIKELVETASAFGSAGVFVALVFGLFTRFGNAASATAAIGVGMLTWASAKYLWGLSAPYLLALILAASAYSAVAVLEGRHETTA
jgi:Na+/proline symporter